VTSHRVVTLAGHVDHGKSSLLRALTAMDPDRLVEERARGLTIELGFVWTDLPGTPTAPDGERVAFVDVPGHERFIATMVAGSGPSSAAMLVVAADDGFSAQSAEHVAILDLLGVPGLVVAITKAGRVDAEWAAMVQEDVRDALRGTTFEDAPMVLVDSLDGTGIPSLRAVLRDRLDAVPRPTGTGDGRLWIDRAFAADGAGTVVTGTLTDGRLEAGTEVHVLPTAGRARIRRLQSLGEDVDAPAPGSRVAVNLAGLDHRAVRRGDVLIEGPPPRPTRIVDAAVRVLPGGRLDGRGAWRLHVGTASTTCIPRPFDGPVEELGAVRITLSAELALRAGDRFVLRDLGRGITAAGGVIVDPSPCPVRGRTARTRHGTTVAAAAGTTVPADRLRTLLELSGGWRAVATLRPVLGTDPAPLLTAARATDVGGIAVLDDTLAGWSRAAAAVGPGIHPRGTVVQNALDAGAPTELADVLPDHLVTVGALSRTTLGLALPEEVDAAGAARSERADRVLEALLATPFAPPPIADCLRDAGLDHRERTALLASGRVVRCEDVHFAAAAVSQAVALLRALEREGGPFTAADARDRLGTSRRFAVPLLDHLARTGVTRFDGERHRFVEPR